MRLDPARVQQVSDFHVARAQAIGEQAAVALPRRRLRAQHRRRGALRFFDQPFEAVVERPRLHVVGVAAESFVVQGHVDRIRHRLSQAAEFGRVAVVDARLLQLPGEGVSIELRVTARPREGPDVDDPFDGDGAQDLE